MKGYIYISSTGTDNIVGRFLNDPILGKLPTLGACMPNIRRIVFPGDRIFVVSGSVEEVPQYIVGGFEVAEKIDALAAFDRFPDYRLRMDDAGNKVGNIIVTQDGKQHHLDNHDLRDGDKFKERIKNYLIGKKPLSIETPKEVDLSRQRTLGLLQDMFEKKGNRAIDVMGRWRKLDEDQIDTVEAFLKKIISDARK